MNLKITSRKIRMGKGGTYFQIVKTAINYSRKTKRLNKSKIAFFSGKEKLKWEREAHISQ